MHGAFTSGLLIIFSGRTLKNMRKILILLLSFFILGTMYSQEWLTFGEGSPSLSAKYPASWAKKIRNDGIVVFSSPLSGDKDNFQENINVIIRENALFTKDFDLKEALPSIIDKLNSTLTDFKQSSIRFFKWNGLEAAELKFTVTNKAEEQDNPLRLKMMQWYCAGEGVFYTATFTALQDNNQFDAEALTLFQSIRFR